MPDLPAFCESCGVAFPSGYFFEDVTGLTLSGAQSGPCPNCGGMGTVPDGVYNVIDRTIEIVAAPAHSREQWQRLLAALESIQKRDDLKESGYASATPDLIRFAPAAEQQIRWAAHMTPWR